MSRKCGTPRCDDPIDMTGFCCPVCGAELTINHGGSLSLARVKTLLQSHLQGSDMKDIRGHVAKMSDQLYHVYFTAANPDGDYKEASESFKTRFNEVLNAANSHEVLVSYAGDMKPLVSGRVAPHHVAVTLVTLTICLVVGAAVYYFRKRRISSSLSFMFRRLENNSRRVSVVSDVIGGRRPSNASSVFAYSRESGLRFLNPIFNQSMASLAGAGVSSVINESAQEIPEEQEEGQHENPMYTAFQNMLPEERKASEKAMEEREKILEAAGQLVASSMKNNKEKRMSVPSENNLESIKEEKDTKDVVSCDADVHHTEGTVDSETSKASNSSPVAEKNIEALQDESLMKDNEEEIPKADIGEVTPEDKTDPPSPNDGADITQTLADIGEDPVISSGHVEHRKSSSSSSSSSDDDADGALSNLEGFTPLVDLKFKK
ncbi:hypothetical protein O3P69_020040 [Scylla paramamosain]|uniref:Protein amnionless n=1 Tax=Scylla paramamosain TaxID=85552 RepID=A0AAW0TKW5_SCYPA